MTEATFALQTDFFLATMPNHPMGRYAHVVVLRELEGYALFQTDGELNRARVQAGVDQTEMMTRITLFKRKQTTPERLKGRELLRRYDLQPECEYNGASCQQCPDCTMYGFAAGDGASTKSKILVDTAYSLTEFAVSHEKFTLNAPHENGTMSQNSEVKSSIATQDHVIPGTIFPSVEATRDLTVNMFAYVLLNILRTKRYGAITTRGGTVRNHIIGIVLTDGEIFSNLRFTQRLYDRVQSHMTSNNLPSIALVREHAEALLPEMIAEEPVRVSQLLMGADLAATLTWLENIPEDDLNVVLSTAAQDAAVFHEKYIKAAKSGKKK